MEEKSINQKTGYIKVEGGRIYYEVAGSGHVLVFIHAGVADSRMWNEQFSYFSTKYRTVRFDLRGFGKSTSEDIPFSYVNDLQRLLKHLEIPKVTLIGCSKGGETALGFTLEFPELVERLVLVGSGLANYVPTDKVFWYKLQDAISKGDLSRLIELQIQMWVLGPDRKIKNADPQFLELAEDMMLISYKQPLLTRQWYYDKTLNIPKYLNEISHPVLIIIGEYDNPDLHEIAQDLHKGIENSQFRMIKNTAHLPSLERPDIFNAILDEFLGN